jgi:predicted nucleic acid-binding protein
MVGGEQDRRAADKAQTLIRSMGFSLVPFDERCIEMFARLRAEMRLKAPDAIHLACAAAAGTDLFLTNDRQLLQRRLHVPGIQFIGDFTQPWI